MNEEEENTEADVARKDRNGIANTLENERMPPAYSNPAMMALSRATRRLADIEEDEIEKQRLIDLADEMKNEAV